MRSTSRAETKWEARGRVGNLVYTDKEVWYYASVPAASWDILTDEERDELQNALDRAFDSYRGMPCHILTAYRPYDVDQWLSNRLAADVLADSYWGDYATATAEHMRRRDYSQLEVYLGICLGKRRGKVKAAWHRVKEFSEVADPAISDEERARWQEKADSLTNQLASGGLQAAPATSEQLEWLMQRNMYFRLPHALSGRPEEVWGETLRMLVDGAVDNDFGQRSLVIHQPTGELHVAFLSVTRAPEDLTGFEWLKLSVFTDVELSMRYELTPPRQAKKLYASKLAAASETIRNAERAGVEVDPNELINARRLLELSQRSGRHNEPLLEGYPRLRVQAADAASLRKRVEQVTTYYAEEFGITLRQPTNQLPFLLESLPGDRLRRSSCGHRRQNRGTLAGSMFVATTQVGDGVGPYLGSAGKTVVHFDPLALASSSDGTVIGIAGRSGHGKTSLTLYMLCLAVIRGATGLYFTIKPELPNIGDFPGFRCQACDDCRQHRECRRGKLNRITLDRDTPHRFDPYKIALDGEEAWNLAVGLLKYFLGQTKVNLTQLAALERACQAEAQLPPTQACLMGAVKRLIGDGLPEIRAIGELLAGFALHPLGKLCFAESDQLPIVPEGKMTLIELAGLDLPAIGLPREDYSKEHRVSEGFISLLAYWSKRVATQNRDLPTVIAMDEAAFLTEATMGQYVINLIALVMGRASWTTLILSTQNPAALLNKPFTINMVVRFVFKITDYDSQTAALAMVGMDDTKENRALLGSLAQGQAIMRDQRGRRAVVDVDLVFEEVAGALDTQPHVERAQAQKAQSTELEGSSASTLVPAGHPTSNGHMALSATNGSANGSVTLEKES